MPDRQQRQAPRRPERTGPGREQQPESTRRRRDPVERPVPDGIDEHEGATEEQVSDRRGPGPGYDEN